MTRRFGLGAACIVALCAIASRDQAIDMDSLPLAVIARDSQSPLRPFSIELVNCTLSHPGNPDWSGFRVTFDGVPDGDGFGVHGAASGVALRIADQAGHRVLPGAAQPARGIVPGNRRLDYSLTLVANHRPLKVGPYASTIRFRLDYF